eukprot:CAMPEP_0194444124 /NCGR_PEP_ID=MMETSP0176-20130528/127089_1 /TAXON_ID=216777 /ORGANISM="Proboscia alata, Strain PI-D3" /LENGTH=451 /DNA_ID=CAMNT_0039270451 /DNA_START=35 /DNA_END=1387 /DNA_ORIENTATION=-
MATMDFTTTPPQMSSIIRGKSPVTSLSFHEDGEHLYIASNDSLLLVNTQSPDPATTTPALRAETHGVRRVEPTHHPLSVLTTGFGSSAPGSAGVGGISSAANVNPGALHSRHAVNYWSLHDNKILRTFRGHTGEISNLSMNPVDDTFLSSSADGTVRLWNLQQPGCLAKLEMPAAGNSGGVTVSGVPYAAFDSTGLVFGITAACEDGNRIHLYDARKYSSGAFAEIVCKSSDLLAELPSKLVGHATSGVTATTATASRLKEMSSADWTSVNACKDGNWIHLYDARKYSSGAFAEIVCKSSDLLAELPSKLVGTSGVTAATRLKEMSSADWTSLQFNASGNRLLVTTKKGIFLLLDGFDGKLLHAFQGEGPPTTESDAASAVSHPEEPLSGCFTPDDKHVLGGCEDGSVSCWDAETGKLCHRLEGHVGRVNAVACNPKTALLATACTNTALW